MPAAPTLNVAAVTLFESELQVDFQKREARLAGLVRRRDFTAADKLRFPLYGKAGDPQPKLVHGKLPVTNPKHAYKELTVEKEYLGTYIENLELLETNIDERTAARNALLFSFARRRDTVIFTAMDETTRVIDATTGGLDQADFELLFQYFGEQEIPESERYFSTSHGTFLQALDIAQFAKQDYLPESMLPFGQGSWQMGKDHMSFRTFYMTGHLMTGTDVKNFAWHRSKIGYGLVQDLVIKPSWENENDAWFFNASINHGACLLPQADSGVVEGVVRVLTEPGTATLS